MIVHVLSLLLALPPASADLGPEAAKQESGIFFAEAPAMPGGAPAVSAFPRGAEGRSAPGLAGFLRLRAGKRSAPPPPPSRKDSFGSPRMVALTMGGYALGTAAMVWMAFAMPLAFFALVPIGAAYVALKKRREGGTRGEVIAGAVKGAFLGLMDGPALLGAWLGIKANGLIDRLADRGRGR